MKRGERNGVWEREGVGIGEMEGVEEKKGRVQRGVEKKWWLLTEGEGWGRSLNRKRMMKRDKDWKQSHWQLKRDKDWKKRTGLTEQRRKKNKVKHCHGGKLQLRLKEIKPDTGRRKIRLDTRNIKKGIWCLWQKREEFLLKGKKRKRERM